jgi:fructoselysine-6-P-deglycase FrlB-like protein
MSQVAQEIASQPQCWRRANELAASYSDALPAAGERVAVVGCGTSWFMAMAYARLREGLGQGETDAFAASEFPAGRRYDRVLAITRSGTTTEILRLPVDVVLTADPRSPVMDHARVAIALPWADERSVVQTRFATSALALLRASLGAPADPSGADEALAAPLPIDPATLTQVTFLGSGWTVGLAHEAALKCREAAGFWAEAYPAMEYRHGPISVAQAGRATWMFGTPPAGLAGEVAATGAVFVASGGLDALAHLVIAQRLAVALAGVRGLDPDRPRHLSRSVILTA